MPLCFYRCSGNFVCRDLLTEREIYIYRERETDFFSPLSLKHFKVFIFSPLGKLLTMNIQYLILVIQPAGTR